MSWRPRFCRLGSDSSPDIEAVYAAYLVRHCVVFSLSEGTKFFNIRNFNDIVIDSSQLVVLTVGMTFVIITAGIDLSVGSILIFRRLWRHR